MTVVSNKKQMYRMLASGEFGNTIPQYFDMDEWWRSEDRDRYAYWGVRSLTPGGPCLLNATRYGVLNFISDEASPAYSISPMVDRITKINLMTEVLETEAGLQVYGIVNPDTKNGNWRSLMPKEGKQWSGLLARNILKQYLNDCSYADLMVLLEQYPGHVVELSACQSCIGTIPGRNAVVWEVRKY